MCQTVPVTSAQVTAEIVVSQADNAPGDYVSGSRDNLLLDKLLTLTNRHDDGAVAHRWTFTAPFGKTSADYGVSGVDGATMTALPPASTGVGDIHVRLEVTGLRLPNGSRNQAVAEAMLGVRVPDDTYTDGIPLPHWFESSAGGPATFDRARGREYRIAEAFGAIRGGSGGGVSAPFPVTVITSGTTAPTLSTAYQRIVASDTTSGAVTVTLPASPTAGMTVTVVNVAASAAYGTTIDGNGKLIDGSSTIPLPYLMDRVTLAYISTAFGWRTIK